MYINLQHVMLSKVTYLCYSKQYEMRKCFIINFVFEYTRNIFEQNTRASGLCYYLHLLGEKINRHTKRTTLMLYKPLVSDPELLYKVEHNSINKLSGMLTRTKLRILQ